MARRSNMGLFMVLMAIAAFQMQSSEAQTTHIVGDSLGWTVPPGGPIAYSTWAATQTFTVGDVLGKFFKKFVLNLILVINYKLF